ncbi:MAG: RimK family alpha-L-glutamate ligase [Rhodospirillales bacterium]|nr:RimK family alpha-L-glutamate ligase [Rhodospirillales bacterium]
MPEGDRGSSRRSDPLRIAVLVDKPDWHARRLIKAFAARGTEALPVPLQACEFTTESQVGLALPGFEERLPDGVFVRCVPGGSFEQVTRRLGILHALDHLGVPLCNDARAIERCVDKSMTTFLLEQAGIPTPETWTCEGEDEAREILRRETQAGHRLVLKPLFGSQGRGLRLLEGPDDLPSAEDMAGVFYLQRFVAGASEGWQDWRIMVANGRPVAAMARRGVQWITNRHQGAECAKAPLEEPLASLASGAARAVGAAYTGVDVIRDRAGQYYVLEVNSMPAWSGLQQVNEVDVTQALADALLALLPTKTPAQHEASGA